MSEIKNEAILYKKAHSERKNNIMSLLLDTKKFFLEYHKEQADTFEKLYDDLKNGDFSIVVVGEFSAGKSTFLNALMQKVYLPSYSSETTATVNFLKHIDKAPDGHSLCVYYNDTQKETLYGIANENSLADFVTTRSSLDVASQINRVELYVDSKFLEDGVVLVDSPGLNGVAKGHREITEKQIEKSHACIFLFSAEQPGRCSDFDFLQQLTAKVDRVFLVLNKIDMIKEEEQTVVDVVRIIKDSYHIKFPNAKIPEIYPVAAYPALVARSDRPLSYLQKKEHSGEAKASYLKNSQIEAFEERLWKFLTCGEKTKEELMAPIQKIEKLVDQYRQMLMNKKSVLEERKDTGELENAILMLQDEIQKLNIETTDQNNQVAKMLKTAIRSLEIEVKNVQRRVGDNFKAQIDDWVSIEDIASEVKNFQTNVVSAYTREIEDLFYTFDNQISDSIFGIVSGNLMEIDKKLATVSKIALEIQTEPNLENIIKYHNKDKYDEDIEKIEKDLQSLNDSVEQGIYDLKSAENITKERDNLNKNLQKIKDDKLLSVESFIPPIRYNEKEERILRDRRGWGGKLMQIFVGKKDDIKMVTNRDDSDQKDFLQKRKIKLEEYEKQENEIKVELSNLGKPNSLLDYEQICSKEKRLRAVKEKELEEFKKDFKEKFEKGNRESLRKLKIQLRRFLDDCYDEIHKQIQNEYSQKQRKIAELLNEQINASTIEIIMNKQQQIENVQSQLKSSVEERNDKIAEYQNQIEVSGVLLQKAASLRLDIEVIETDMIKMEDYSEK
ncbi:Dynamin family protein [Propionispira arboris]|uniref:Dynamin family protein n=1 Tax=Propionispira arboris TaxID=84035 RepID=A0A1H6ZN96_9FIRM|nr:dynamin family protein [Propionispira arboris]SEJ54718.1 Dynamin family protein [Propionispira arboris]